MRTLYKSLFLSTAAFLTSNLYASKNIIIGTPISSSSQSSAEKETCDPTLHAQFKKAFNTLASKIFESQNMKIDIQVSDPKAKLLNLLGVLNSASGTFSLSGDRLHVQIPEIDYSLLINENNAFESTKSFYNFYSDVSATKLSFFTQILGTLKSSDADALIKFEKIF